MGRQRATTALRATGKRVAGHLEEVLLDMNLSPGWVQVLGRGSGAQLSAFFKAPQQSHQ